MAFNFKHQSGHNFQRNKKRKFFEQEKAHVPWRNKVLVEKTSVQELVPLILKDIEADNSYYYKASEICDNLSHILNYFYQDFPVSVEAFGSFVTKLALKGSDIDVFLNFGDRQPETSKQFLNTLRNRVRKYGYFTRSIAIPARVPIVQCVHRNGVSCDISFSNALGVCNSKLIKFFISLDERIRPLMLILKHLLKEEGVVGQTAFTSFAVVILVVFFLQNIENPILPSVSCVQNLAKQKSIVADWNTSFTQQRNLLPVNENKLSLVELLLGFFEYYSVFDFGFYVISSFSGKSYLKTVFSQENLLPDEFELYKTNVAKNDSFKFDCSKLVCVQGPFNLGNNITRNTTQKILLKFHDFCSDKAAMGRKLLNENKHVEFLVKLFNKKVEGPSEKKIKKEKCEILVGTNLNFEKNCLTEEELRKEWSNFILNNLKNILCKVFKCDVGEAVTEEKTVLQCKMPYHELFTKLRTQARNEFNFPQNMTDIQKEEVISNYLCDTTLKDQLKLSAEFELICTVMKNPTRFSIEFQSKETNPARNNLVQQAFQFLNSNIYKWIHL